MGGAIYLCVPFNIINLVFCYICIFKNYTELILWELTSWELISWGPWGRHGLGFYMFPAVPEARRKEWIRAVKRQDWVPSKYSRICGDHFLSGKLTRSHS